MTTDQPMQLGMVGLGRMGANIVRRLMADGHDCNACGNVSRRRLHPADFAVANMEIFHPA